MPGTLPTITIFSLVWANLDSLSRPFSPTDSPNLFLFITNHIRLSGDGDVSVSGRRDEKQLLFSAGGFILDGALCALMGPGDSGETRSDRRLRCC